MAVVAGYPLGNLSGSSTAQPQSQAVVVETSTLAYQFAKTSEVIIVRLTVSGGGSGGDGGSVGYPIIG